MKITPVLDGTIAQLTASTMRTLLGGIAEVKPAGLFRASEDALRSAVRTYLRMDKLTEEQINEAKKGQQ